MAIATDETQSSQHPEQQSTLPVQIADHHYAPREFALQECRRVRCHARAQYSGPTLRSTAQTSAVVPGPTNAAGGHEAEQVMLGITETGD